MSQPAIEVSGLSKRYVIQRESRHDNLRDTLHHSARKVWRKLRWGTGFEKEDFWALRDVSFSVQPGEVLGIIGRNGAGKSTLLKILSRITEPTSGNIKLRGRVASLLEVGTGFHPELSGRENIFLNGAILGMSRVEIKAKFDEIVAFAEVDQFLDTPVKRYSSGMYVRLAFAVAAHLDPEILIVDEVLAVGDAQFQNKCLGKIRTVARESGRAVLFVSHNLSIVQSVCNRCLILKEGRVEIDGTPGEAVTKYLESQTHMQWHRAHPIEQSCGLTSVTVSPNAEGEVEIVAEIESRAEQTIAFEVFLHDSFGQNIAMGALGNLIGTPPIKLIPGRHQVRANFPAHALANGHYRLSFKLVVPFVALLDEVQQAVAFDLELPPPAGSSHRLLQKWGGGSFMLALREIETRLLSDHEA